MPASSTLVGRRPTLALRRRLTVSPFLASAREWVGVAFWRNYDTSLESASFSYKRARGPSHLSRPGRRVASVDVRLRVVPSPLGSWSASDWAPSHEAERLPRKHTATVWPDGTRFDVEAALAKGQEAEKARAREAQACATERQARTWLEQDLEREGRGAAGHQQMTRLPEVCVRFGQLSCLGLAEAKLFELIDPSQEALAVRTDALRPARGVLRSAPPRARGGPAARLTGVRGPWVKRVVRAQPACRVRRRAAPRRAMRSEGRS